MKESENLYDKIREMFGQDPGSFNIMEDKIDVDLQVEYFDFSREVKKKYELDWALEKKELLFEATSTLEDKKTLLARLASIEEVWAYRMIEEYQKAPDKGLEAWSTLALQESKMHIESDLLEENQIFISTGLGGRGSKLRYFVVLIARGRNDLNEFQVDIINKEFPYVLTGFDAEVEEITASGYLAAITLLLPMQYSVKEVFAGAIRECNQYGEFLRESCIVTNVKKLSFDEVTDFIEQKKDKNQEPEALD